MGTLARVAMAWTLKRWIAAKRLPDNNRFARQRRAIPKLNVLHGNFAGGLTHLFASVA